jgi:hypothetical protein
LLPWIKLHRTALALWAWVLGVGVWLVGNVVGDFAKDADDTATRFRQFIVLQSRTQTILSAVRIYGGKLGDLTRATQDQQGSAQAQMSRQIEQLQELDIRVDDHAGFYKELKSNAEQLGDKDIGRRIDIILEEVQFCSEQIKRAGEQVDVAQIYLYGLKGKPVKVPDDDRPKAIAGRLQAASTLIEAVVTRLKSDETSSRLIVVRLDSLAQRKAEAANFWSWVARIITWALYLAAAILTLMGKLLPSAEAGDEDEMMLET